MYGLGVDTLKAARTLEKAGFDSAQAEALVAAFGGSVAGGAATREDLRDLRNASREDTRATRDELKEEIAEVRSEMRAGFAAVRGEIAEVRTELKGEIAELCLFPSYPASPLCLLPSHTATPSHTPATGTIDHAIAAVPSPSAPNPANDHAPTWSPAR